MRILAENAEILYGTEKDGDAFLIKIILFVPLVVNMHRYIHERNKDNKAKIAVRGSETEIEDIQNPLYGNIKNNFGRALPYQESYVVCLFRNVLRMSVLFFVRPHSCPCFCFSRWGRCFFCKSKYGRQSASQIYSIPDIVAISMSLENERRIFFRSFFLLFCSPYIGISSLMHIRVQELTIDFLYVYSSR